MNICEAMASGKRFRLVEDIWYDEDGGPGPWYRVLEKNTECGPVPTLYLWSENEAFTEVPDKPWLTPGQLLAEWEIDEGVVVPEEFKESLKRNSTPELVALLADLKKAGDSAEFLQAVTDELKTRKP